MGLDTRQAGKTTILENHLKKTKKKYKLDSGDNLRTQQILGSQDFFKILAYAEGYDLIAIDEAQQIPNIGMALKILCDKMPNLSIIATGSSSFDFAQSVGEPLTGRKKTLTLYPVAQLELAHYSNRHDLNENLSNSLLFGGYPEIVSAKTREEKISLLHELTDSYLLKDILALEKIKKSEALFNLIKLLAFQIGQLVSLNELATQLHIDVKTVSRYLDLLEKSFVIYKLSGYSSNLRKEVTKKHKYYFIDNGVRNSVIAQFNPLNLRNDIGQLWENFIFIERVKKTSYQGFYGNRYFWRSYKGEEVDFIEEIENQLLGYEIKWGENKIPTAPQSWVNDYRNTSFELINRSNYQEFII